MIAAAHYSLRKRGMMAFMFPRKGSCGSDTHPWDSASISHRHGKILQNHIRGVGRLRKLDSGTPLSQRLFPVIS